MSEKIETATFAAGCFWGVEARFRQIPGVVDARVGYIGGHVENPDYRQVCSDTTGHAEAVELRFDPAQVDYESLLAAFFAMHDPTTLNRQGPDIGSQYRSAIFTHDERQADQARTMIEQLTKSGRYRTPIVTQVVPVTTFWEAEAYHQRYLERRGGGCA